MAKLLDPKVLGLLAEYTGLEESTLRKKISQNKSKNPGLTSNASAHIIAQEYGRSILRRLDSEDKSSLKGYINPKKVSPKVEITKSVPRRKKVVEKKKPIISYQNDDYFIKAHLEETNRAFHAKCYTSVFILTRKILENLLIEILRNKFPSDLGLILNTSTGRYHDFSIILDNLYTKRTQFSSEGKSIIERINQLVKPFKKDANAKAHSWFHIVKSAKEIDRWQLDTIFELIVRLEKEVGLRR